MLDDGCLCAFRDVAMPLTRVESRFPLAQLEQDGAELARFLGVNLEGL